MCSTDFNYYATKGDLKLARYLREREGRSPGPVARAFTALGMKFPPYRAHSAARERLRGILDMAYETPTGRALIEAGAAGGTSVAFGLFFGPGEGRYDGGHADMVSVSEKSPDDYLANIIVHELQHAQQERAITAAFGDPRYFYARAKGVADTAYPMLLGEAEAYAVQAVQALEMHRQGRPEPWALQRGSKRYVGQVLEGIIEKGGDASAAETRRALVAAWLSRPEARAAYDAEYLRDVAWGGIFLPEAPGLTHTNAELLHIMDDPAGNCAVGEMDLTKPAYLGFWAGLRPEQDLVAAAEAADAAADVLARTASCNIMKNFNR